MFSLSIISPVVVVVVVVVPTVDAVASDGGGGGGGGDVVSTLPPLTLKNSCRKHLPITLEALLH